MSYHLRNARREATKKLLLAQLPADWRPMKWAKVDAIFTLRAKRDRFELPMSLKIEMDAAQEVGIIESDGPEFLTPGTLKMQTSSGGRQRGVRLRFTRLSGPVQEPELAF